VYEDPLQKTAPGNRGAPQGHNLQARPDPTCHGGRCFQAAHDDEVEQGREGHQNGDDGEEYGPVDGEFTHQQIRGAIFHQSCGRGQQVNNRALDGDRKADDNALSSQHHNFVGKTVNDRRNGRPFSRHQQPTGEEREPEPENISLAHSGLHFFFCDNGDIGATLFRIDNVSHRPARAVEDFFHLVWGYQ
jgi:hypothetical protein